MKILPTIRDEQRGLEKKVCRLQQGLGGLKAAAKALGNLQEESF